MSASNSTEILNLHYHIRRMVIKALNKYPTEKHAAAALGIHPRTVWQYKKQFNIEWNKDQLVYQFKNQQPCNNQHTIATKMSSPAASSSSSQYL